jgi:L-sorbose 1-phosphate reductase
MTHKFNTYRQGKLPDTDTYRLWPLYGAGLENLGKDGNPINVPLPEVGPDELLVRHDACGLCFSDIKVIRLGQEHPRIYRDMRKDPVVLGHEVALTVVKVGDSLTDRYQPGDRFIIQADIFIDGIGYAYGYEIQGGLSQYNIIDQRVLNGDDGNYLIPIRPDTGYAESALVEPWACVIAAYYLTYRQTLKDGGTAWFVGPEDGAFTLSEGLNADSHPAKIKLTAMDGPFGQWLRERSAELGITIQEMSKLPSMDVADETTDQVDDIILLSPTSDLIEQISPHLAYHGMLVFSSSKSFERKVNMDVGRVHYNRWLFLGGEEKDLSKIYHKAPARSDLKPGGKAMFVGAGGPMGRMHVQHAIESIDPPSVILCSDVSEDRLRDIDETFREEARAKGIEWRCANPLDSVDFTEKMAKFQKAGFDDIIMLAPNAKVIADSTQWLAEGGLMNIFAGVPRGVMAEIDMNELVHKDIRLIGHSASTIENMLTMLQKVENGELNTNRSVAAVGSLSAAKEGLQALIDATYPGKVVIFPNIRELPLTSVSDLGEVLPEVAAKLADGHIWTKEAEREFLSQMTEE